MLLQQPTRDQQKGKEIISQKYPRTILAEQEQIIITTTASRIMLVTTMMMTMIRKTTTTSDDTTQPCKPFHPHANSDDHNDDDDDDEDAVVQGKQFKVFLLTRARTRTATTTKQWQQTRKKNSVGVLLHLLQLLFLARLVSLAVVVDATSTSSSSSSSSTSSSSSSSTTFAATTTATTTTTTPSSSSSSFSSSSSSSTSSTTSSSRRRRPPFVSHVTKDDLRQALQVAKQRHAQAVQNALLHYPTATTTPEDDAAAVAVDPLVATMELQSYPLTHAPSALPDFTNQELPKVVYVTQTPLFTADECQHVIQAAQAHFMQHHYQNGTWTQLPSGQYQVAGFWIKDIPAVHEWFLQAVQTKLFPLLQRTFPDCIGDSPTNLCVDNAYLFQYTPETGRRTEIHTDSGCLSFTIALNTPGVDFTGGGTWFEGLDDGSGNTDNHTNNNATISMSQGQVTIRPGGVKHCGQAVESGVRYVIGGFCMHRHRPEPVRQLLSPPTTVANVQAAIVLNPNFDPSYNVLSRALKDEATAKNQNNNDAAMAAAAAASTLQQRQQVLEYCLQHVHPYAGDVAYDLASVYQAQGKLEQAVRCLETACLRADPNDVEALVALLMLAAQLGDTDKERLYAHRILQAPSAPPSALAKAYCNLGVLSAGTNDEIPYYQQALAHDPTRFAPRYSLACAYASQHEWQNALTEFRHALAVLTPDELDHEEKRVQTLKQLYVAAARQIQVENNQSSSSSGDEPKYKTQDQVMQRFGELMGEDHFQTLLALPKQ